MEKTFIEQLEKKQIEKFLEIELPKETEIKFERNDTNISVHAIFNSRYESHMKLTEYGVDGCFLESKWIRYLYSIFGEKYKEAYLKHCSKIFD